MAKTFTVPLAGIIKETMLETIYMPAPPEEILVYSSDVNRPGLALSGYFDYFDNDRVQVMGKSEFGFLEDLAPETRALRLDELASHKPPAMVVSRGLEIFPELKASCEKYQVPLLRTADTTSGFMASLIAYLNVQLAPRITRHGVFVEVYGEGILLMGDSGVGKSETAIELVKRGHRLIADDAVEIRRVSSKTLVGSAPDNIRHFIERGASASSTPPASSAWALSKVTDENRHGHPAGTLGQRKGLRPHGPGQRIHRHSGHHRAPADHPGQARPEPGHHHRGGLDEQPAEKNGL